MLVDHVYVCSYVYVFQVRVISGASSVDDTLPYVLPDLTDSSSHASHTIMRQCVTSAQSSLDVPTKQKLQIMLC